eukprot:364163-Chlamydomonas_euryale.AAC.6
MSWRSEVGLEAGGDGGAWEPNGVGSGGAGGGGVAKISFNVRAGGGGGLGGSGLGGGGLGGGGAYSSVITVMDVTLNAERAFASEDGGAEVNFETVDIRAVLLASLAVASAACTVTTLVCCSRRAGPMTDPAATDVTQHTVTSNSRACRASHNALLKSSSRPVDVDRAV